MKLKILFVGLILTVTLSCDNDKLSRIEQDTISSNPRLFHDSVEKLTDVIIHDIFSPPVASRIYVYPCIAAYETLQQISSEHRSLVSQLNGLTKIPDCNDTTNMSFELAAIAAFLKSSQSLIFSETKISQYRNELLKNLDSLQVSDKYVKNSFKYGELVADHILAWAALDNYKQNTSAPKHSISDEPGEWKPTPPAYMEGIEPSWRNIRTLVLQNAQQFQPAAPPPFSTKIGTEFRQLTDEVKVAVDTASDEHIAIASFWDCNPYVMNQTGHLMYASKKITPGGHWMGIASIASKDSNFDMLNSIEVSTLTAIGLFDGFISCWDEKYRSNLIRPETVINQYIDKDWKPILQTPPFPEHTSGHSVISSSAATILTNIIGDNFSYIDDVEVKYGLPKRSFTSFLQAADEAAISRLYGGIHYMPAITDGVKQGRKVGQFIIENISTRK